MTKTVTLLTRAYSNLESCEEIEAFVFPISRLELQVLIKMKKDFESLHRKYQVHLESLKFTWVKGRFISLPDPELSSKISREILLDSKLKLSLPELEITLDNLHTLITPQGFSVVAQEKGNQVQWFTKTIHWDVLKQIESQLKL